MMIKMKYIYKTTKSVLIVALLFFIFFKLFIFLNQLLLIMKDIKIEDNFNLSDIEKIKYESQIKIANIENDKLILKVCLDYKELIDFVSCVETLKK